MSSRSTAEGTMLVLWASLSTLCTVLWINCPTASFGPFGGPQADRPVVSTTRFGVSACQCLRMLVRILRGNLIRCQLRSARRELCYMPLLDAGALVISNGILKTWCSTQRAFTVYTSSPSTSSLTCTTATLVTEKCKSFGLRVFAADGSTRS